MTQDSPLSDYALPEENTLGVVLGRRNRAGVPAGSTAGRAMRQASPRGASLGTGYLGIGATVLAGIQGLYGLGAFAVHFSAYPSALPAILAWVVYAVAVASISITIAMRGEQLTGWMFGCFLFALAAVVALDLIAIWPLHDVGAHATASVAAGFGLLIAVTLRRGREIVAAAGAIGAVLIVAIVLDTPAAPQTLPAQIVTVAVAIAPAMIAVYVISRFRRIVQLELDRVLVQSTVSAPRFAVGMLASEELARLDLAAEELLDSVSTGRTALPLSPKMASIAASLATELRLHLIEGRRETWLYHAITESEQLGKRVTLTDRGGLAGLLDARQRDGLLGAVWLLVAADGAKTNSGATAQLTVGPITTPAATGRGTIGVPIRIDTTSVARNRVDPAIWNAIDRVGRFRDSMHDSSLRVEIECVVANPAEQ